LILRTRAQKFYYVANIRAGELLNAQVIALRTNSRLEACAGESIQFAINVAERPKR